MTNLSTYEAPPALGDQPQGMLPASSCETAPPQNIGDSERLISKLTGAGLIGVGLLRGGWSGLVAAAAGGGLLYRGWTGHCYCYEALGIDSTANNAATAVPAQQGVKVEKSLNVNTSPDNLYAYWRDLENLPRVMRHLERVEVIDGQRSRWVAKGPFGVRLEWEAEIITDSEPETIAWRSLPGSDVETAGSVHFRSLGNDRGAALTVSLKYNPPGGKLSDALASLFGQDLDQDLDEDLRIFKAFIEAGEAPTTLGQPTGPAS